MIANTETSGSAAKPTQSSPGWGKVVTRNMFSNFVGQAVMTALVLVSVPLFTRHLGTAGFGAFVLLMPYVETFSLLGLGLNAALVKFLAELLPAGKIEEA